MADWLAGWLDGWLKEVMVLTSRPSLTLKLAGLSAERERESCGATGAGHCACQTLVRNGQHEWPRGGVSSVRLRRLHSFCENERERDTALAPSRANALEFFVSQAGHGAMNHAVAWVAFFVALGL